MNCVALTFGLSSTLAAGVSGSSDKIPVGYARMGGLCAGRLSKRIPVLRGAFNHVRRVSSGPFIAALPLLAWAESCWRWRSGSSTPVSAPASGGVAPAGSSECPVRSSCPWWLDHKLDPAWDCGPRAIGAVAPVMALQVFSLLLRALVQVDQEKLEDQVARWHFGNCG